MNTFTSTKLFSQWKLYLLERLKDEDDIRKDWVFDEIPEISSNFLAHCELTKQGIFVPEAVKRNYIYRPDELFVREPLFDERVLPKPFPQTKSNRKVVVLLGAAGSGKSALLHGFFTHGNREYENVTLYPDTEPYSQAIVSSDRRSVGLGRYGDVSKRGLDALTDKGPLFLQRYIQKAWFDTDIDVLLFEGVHSAYLSLHKMLCALQGRFHRDIYLVFLDCSVEELAYRIWNRSGGLHYTRKEVVPCEIDYLAAFDKLVRACKWWENLKIIYRDDGEVFRGDPKYRVSKETHNKNGSLRNSRHMRLIYTQNLHPYDVMKEFLGFIEGGTDV